MVSRSPTGMFTACSTSSPSRKATSCRATSTATLTCASLRVGAQVRRDHHPRVLDQALDRGDAGGSSLHTSTAAPATWPDVERGEQVAPR